MDAAPKLSRKEQTHERILETAARAIRRSGCAGVGVAEVMKEAGLTHGGFYAHFSSREAMLAEAIEHAGQQSSRRLARGSAAGRALGASPLRALIDAYLSDAHIAGMEEGCAVAALASDIARQSGELREASCRRVQGLLAAVQQVLPAALEPSQAMVLVSGMVGALQLARALGDNAQGRALLAVNRQALLAQYDLEDGRQLPPP